MAEKTSLQNEIIKASNSSKKVTKAKKVAKKTKKVVKKKTPAKKIIKKKVEKPIKKVTSMEKNKEAYLVIDYPVENEIIKGLHYAIRIGATPLGYVELSFNEGEWQPCRHGAGFWWFDWGYFTPGKYKIQARLVDANGEVVLKTLPRKCNVC